MKNPRKIFFILIPVILFGVIFYISTKETGTPQDVENQQLLPTGSPNERGEVIDEERNAAVAQGEENQKRIETINYVVENISRLSPVNPSSGYHWSVSRFWFTDDTNFYVEYDDKFLLRKLLISEVDDSYMVVGYFEPGDNDWNLMKGNDPFFSFQLDLYEHSDQLGKWTKRN